MKSTKQRRQEIKARRVQCAERKVRCVNARPVDCSYPICAHRPDSRPCPAYPCQRQQYEVGGGIPKSRVTAGGVIRHPAVCGLIRLLARRRVNINASESGLPSGRRLGPRQPAVQCLGIEFQILVQQRVERSGRQPPLLALGLGVHQRPQTSQ